MAMAKLLMLLVALVAAGCCSSPCSARPDMKIQMPTARSVDAAGERLGSGEQHGKQAGSVPCESWRLAVETHNIRDWKLVPEICEHYVGYYMVGGQYRRDSHVVVNEAIAYAEGLNLTGDGKEVWVFDIDETSLSTLPFLALYGFGSKQPDVDSATEYRKEGSSPALPETLRLYNRLLLLGIRPVFLTGRTGTDMWQAITERNLRRQGYACWEKLLMKPKGLKASAIVFKSGERKKLQDAGYVIVGNIGDQWSDILGAPEGARTFKLPNPMYYIG